MVNQLHIDAVVIIIFATIGLIIPAIVISHHYIGIDPLLFLNITWGRTFFGIVFTILATIVCLWNFYLSILVPWLYVRMHGSMKNFACTSGLPLPGGFFVLFSGVLMPPSILLGTFLLLLYVIDGNGFPVFFFSIIRNGM